MERLKEILHSRNCSCVVENRGAVRIFYNRGIKDLYTIYTTEPTLLCGAKIADKVVGRAAAALMILGGVECLYTDVISDLALDLLNNSSIKVSYNRSVCITTAILAAAPLRTVPERCCWISPPAGAMPQRR